MISDFGEIQINADERRNIRNMKKQTARSQVMIEYFLLLMVLAVFTVLSITTGLLSKVKSAGKTFSQSCISKIVN